MPLSREQVYNDLNGEEAKQILLDRFAARLNEVPWLQRHLTLPRVRMKLAVTFELYADQPTPESHRIEDDYTLRTDQPSPTQSTSRQTIPRNEPELIETLEGEELIDASPTTGKPPDQIREESGLPIPTPVRDRTTRQLGDMPDVSHLTDGVTIERKKGPAGPSSGVTFVTQDFGPARGRTEEMYPSLRNRDRAVEPGPIKEDFRNR